MSTLKLSRHGSRRMRQRSFPSDAVDLFETYGREFRRRGAWVYLFGKQERSRVRAAIGTDGYKSIERKLNGYVVESDGGLIITCGYRTRRLYAA